jgi:hypothetical protein
MSDVPYKHMNVKIGKYEVFVAVAIIVNIAIFMVLSKHLESYMTDYYTKQALASEVQ